MCCDNTYYTVQPQLAEIVCQRHQSYSGLPSTELNPGTDIKTFVEAHQLPLISSSQQTVD